MKIGIISLGGPTSKLVAKECQKYFDEVVELSLKKFDVRLINDETKVSYMGEDLRGYDCLYIRGSHKYGFLQRVISEQFIKDVYMPITPKAFTMGHDKFLTSLVLKKQGVNVPKTYYAVNSEVAKQILDNVVSYPILLKAQSGTHGKGVLIADNPKTAKGILDILEAFKQPFLIQEFVQTENTSDIRVIVCGKKVIASYLRVACDGEFRSNVHSGGQRREHKITKEQERLALKSAKALGVDICGVDILNSKEPSVIEINLSPSFHAVSEVCCTNAVWEVAKELYNQTIKFHEKKEKKFKKKIEKRAKKANGNAKNGKVESDLNNGFDVSNNNVSLTKDVVVDGGLVNDSKESVVDGFKNDVVGDDGLVSDSKGGVVDDLKKDIVIENDLVLSHTEKKVEGKKVNEIKDLTNISDSNLVRELMNDKSDEEKSACFSSLN